MSSNERMKRPISERSGPRRNLSTLFGAPQGSGASEESGDSARPKIDGSLGNAVAQSVELGYRVIDEYIRQGQKTAQRFNDRSFAPDAMMGDVQELSTRMAQYASEFAGLWFELMQMTTGNLGRWPVPPFGGFGTSPTGSAGDSPTRSAGPAPAPASAESVRPTRVKVAVTSPYPTEVSLDLRPHAGRHLAVQALRAADELLPRLSNTAIEDAGDDGPVTLRICVPPGQPPGVYNGMIIDEVTGVAVGTISLRIAPE